MKIIWLGHAGFRIEIGDQILLVDPWLRGNPVFDEANFDKAIDGATAVLLTHGHGDHSGNAPEIAKAKDVPIVGMYDYMQYLEAEEGVSTIGFNKGGTVRLGDVEVTMVNAVHSSSAPGIGYAGAEAGFMIAGEGETIYFSGDTDVMADMAIFEDLHQPKIGILCVGGHFTMDQRRAAYAAKKFFKFQTIIPCHYRTFPLLAQNADELKAALPDVDVIEPEVLQAIEL